MRIPRFHLILSFRRTPVAYKCRQIGYRVSIKLEPATLAIWRWYHWALGVPFGILALAMGTVLMLAPQPDLGLRISVIAIGLMVWTTFVGMAGLLIWGRESDLRRLNA